jgi:repressor LexA
VSPQTADFHLRALARKGALELRPRSARAVREPSTSASGSAPRRVPLLGRVAAGAPLPALEDAEGEVPLPAGCRADFALRVEGDSMIEAGILPGDLVLVQQARTARTGEIVVALFGSGETTEATVKRFRTRGGRVVLEPANRRLRPRTVDPAEEFALAGRVVGVLRWWK